MQKEQSILFLESNAIIKFQSVNIQVFLRFEHDKSEKKSFCISTYHLVKRIATREWELTAKMYLQAT